MRVLTSLPELSCALDDARAAGHTVGLVPTMGALHAGHRSLVERAAAECDTVAVTIFVNPLQFGDPDDIAHYPRTEAADIEVCDSAGASVVLVPTVAEMYPDGPGAVRTAVSVAGVSGLWEGRSRPGHFDGVTTVVAKLFATAGRCRAYFGEKDFQQLAVVRRMARDMSFPVQVVGCPTVRERDGLALSSRNVRLSAAERSAAVVLSRALDAGRRAVEAGDRRPDAVTAAMSTVVATEPLVELDYACVVEPGDLSVPPTLRPAGDYRVLIAAAVGPVRLIDNCPAVAAAGARRPAGQAGRAGSALVGAAATGTP